MPNPLEAPRLNGHNAGSSLREALHALSPSAQRAMDRLSTQKSSGLSTPQARDERMSPGSSGTLSNAEPMGEVIGGAQPKLQQRVLDEGSLVWAKNGIGFDTEDELWIGIDRAKAVGENNIVIRELVEETLESAPSISGPILTPSVEDQETTPSTRSRKIIRTGKLFIRTSAQVEDATLQRWRRESEAKLKEPGSNPIVIVKGDGPANQYDDARAQESWERIQTRVEYTNVPGDGHTHRWLIGTPNGHTSPGMCKCCGQQKEFKNSNGEDYIWD